MVIQSSESLLFKINACNAHETGKALTFFQEYLERELGASHSTWCAFYQGSYGKEMWQTKVMKGWKVVDMVFPVGRNHTLKQAQKVFFDHTKEHNNISPTVSQIIDAAGQTRAHLPRATLNNEQWRKDWTNELLGKWGINDRMIGAYNLSGVSESHLWIDRAPNLEPFNSEQQEKCVDLITRFPRLHRWLFLERGLVEPASRPLSPREREVLKLLLGPKTEKQFIDILGLAKGTIHNYITEIYRVFNVSSRYQLVQLWLH